jgi:putative endopeptidase
MRSLLVSGLVGFGLFGFNAMGLADSSRSSGIQMADIDRLVRPQDDLFSYANGTWLRNVPIPADRSHFGVDTLMQEHSLVQQRELLEQALASTHVDARKAALFYASYMDALSVERAGLSPLRIELKSIETLRSLADLAGRLGHLEKIGVATPIELYVQPDAKNTTRYALWVTQSGLGLPDRDYYLKEDGHYKDLRAKYQAHIEKLLRLSGDATAAKAAEAILRFETQVAKVQWTVIDRRDPNKTYNPQTFGQIQALAPVIEWHDYLSAAGIAPTPVTLVVRQPDYLKALSELFRITPLSTLKAYLRFRLISDYGQFLPHVFADEDFAFNEGVLHDTPRLPERSKRACLLIDHLMGDALGRLYAERFFPANAKTGAGQIVINLMSAYADSIEHLDWLSPTTRQQALLKLQKMRVRIGYPAIWRDYAALEIKQRDLLGNVIRARALESARQFGKLTRTVDLNEWEMTVPTVDAGYNPATNSIEFPAGILQPPLYDPSADDAYNYGNTGATIGHEISHAFDNRGSQYDGDGALRDWWTPQDHAAFKTRTDLLIKEFDAFEPVTGHHVNGTLTLPENIADLAGLEIAYKAYIFTLKGREAPVIDGWTGAQRFFVGYAQSYLGKRRQELLIAQLASNPHAPEADRVNGIVPHLESFYTAFAMKPSDKMYIAPGLRIDLW